MFYSKRNTRRHVGNRQLGFRSSDNPSNVVTSGTDTHDNGLSNASESNLDHRFSVSDSVRDTPMYQQRLTNLQRHYGNHRNLGVLSAEQSKTLSAIDQSFIDQYESDPIEDDSEEKTRWQHALARLYNRSEMNPPIDSAALEKTKPVRQPPTDRQIKTALVLADMYPNSEMRSSLTKSEVRDYLKRSENNHDPDALVTPEEKTALAIAVELQDWLDRQSQFVNKQENPTSDSDVKNTEEAESKFISPTEDKTNTADTQQDKTLTDNPLSGEDHSNSSNALSPTTIVPVSTDKYQEESSPTIQKKESLGDIQPATQMNVTSAQIEKLEQELAHKTIPDTADQDDLEPFFTSEEWTRLTEWMVSDVVPEILEKLKKPESLKQGLSMLGRLKRLAKGGGIAGIAISGGLSVLESLAEIDWSQVPDNPEDEKDSEGLSVLDGLEIAILLGTGKGKHISPKQLKRLKRLGGDIFKKGKNLLRLLPSKLPLTEVDWKNPLTTKSVTVPRNASPAQLKEIERIKEFQEKTHRKFLEGYRKFSEVAVNDNPKIPLITSKYDTPRSAKSAIERANAHLKTIDKRALADAAEIMDSLKKTGKLPDRYITQKTATDLGWKQGENVNKYAKGKQLGGTFFRDDDNLLPKKDGRRWYEADIGLDNTVKRSSQDGSRLVYSSDGLVYLTNEHYHTFIYMGKIPMKGR